jgi:hypothetical protein
VSIVPLALITGARGHLGPAAAAVSRTGFEVLTWEAGTPAATADPNRRSLAGTRRKANAGCGVDGPLDCYVQLPCGSRAAEDLVCRMDALAAVAGRLRPNASVILAVEDAEPFGPWAGSLAPDLLAAVALALLEDLGRPTARVAVLRVADLCRPPVEAPVVVTRPAQWEIPTPPLVSAP